MLPGSSSFSFLPDPNPAPHSQPRGLGTLGKPILGSQTSGLPMGSWGLISSSTDHKAPTVCLPKTCAHRRWVGVGLHPFSPALQSQMAPMMPRPLGQQLHGTELHGDIIQRECDISAGHVPLSNDANGVSNTLLCCTCIQCSPPEPKETSWNPHLRL